MGHSSSDGSGLMVEIKVYKQILQEKLPRDRWWLTGEHTYTLTVRSALLYKNLSVFRIASRHLAKTRTTALTSL